MDVVTFEYRTENTNHKVIVTSTATQDRIDVPGEGYSFLYNPAADFYTGLEHKNYTYWEFSWPEVRGAVENSKRFEKRLQDLGNDGMAAETQPASATPTSTDGSDTNAPASTLNVSSTAGADGYVWRPTLDKKKISGLDCIRWTGETETGEDIDAWCYAGPLPKLQAAIEILRKVNGPMALVPIRTIVPDQIFPVYDALAKGGVTPVMISWGEQRNRNTFRFVEARTQDGQLALFTVPKLYTKTTLVTMDGLVDSQPVPGQRPSSAPTHTWQDPSMNKKLSQPPQ